MLSKKKGIIRKSKKYSKMNIICHRGASSQFPENTHLAIKHCLEYGCSGSEIDIQLTKDKKIIILHDITLERTSIGIMPNIKMDEKYFVQGDENALFKNRIKSEYCQNIYKLKMCDFDDASDSTTKALECFKTPGILTRATFGTFGIPAYNSRIKKTKRPIEKDKTPSKDLYKNYYQIIY